MRKSLYGFILACLLATGCKEAGVDKPAEGGNTGDTTAKTEGGNSNARSGKIDLAPRRQRPELPADTTNNGSGENVSRESREDRRARRLAQFDTDGDGKISDDERKAARAKRAETMRTKADANGDGKVTAEELQNASGSLRRLDPAEVDTNKDGDISVDELTTALENRSRRWGSGGRFGRLRERLRQRNNPGGEAPTP